MQAAQKINPKYHDSKHEITAVQAAQKLVYQSGLYTPQITAVQAAQKPTLQLRYQLMYDYCRVGSLESRVS